MKIKSAGFTLMELLIVVVVIGILSAVALPAYRKAVEKSRVADALTTMDAVAKSEHAWYLEHSNYTDDFANLDIDLAGEIEDEQLKTSFYNYELVDTGIVAERNNGEYLIYRDYDTNQIMCTPGSHYICDDLGAFTKVPCEKLDMAWANTNSTCYINEKSRCLDLHADKYGEDIWKGTFCGYDGERGQTLEEGMDCRPEDGTNNCQNSIIKAGGICKSMAYQPGAGWSCSFSKVYSGGVCKANGADSCRGSTIYEGGECWNCGNANYAGKGATSGCCRGSCPGSAPRCECPNHERMDSSGNCITE